MTPISKCTASPVGSLTYNPQVQGIHDRWRELAGRCRIRLFWFLYTPNQRYLPPLFHKALIKLIGLLTLSNVEHLQFIPREHIKLENRNLLRSIVETLITSNSEGITFEELAKLFGKKVMVTWKEVSNGPIQSFVELELSKRVTYVDGKVW